MMTVAAPISRRLLGSIEDGLFIASGIAIARAARRFGLLRCPGHARRHMTSDSFPSPCHFLLFRAGARINARLSGLLSTTTKLARTKRPGHAYAQKPAAMRQLRPPAICCRRRRWRDDAHAIYVTGRRADTAHYRRQLFPLILAYYFMP